MRPSVHILIRNKGIYVLLFSVFFYVTTFTYVFAATGTIDAAQKYAWSNVGGWVNFAPSMSEISVTDTELTGYAWSMNNGWLNLSPANGGVVNDGAGNLSGNAWDETSGWISFDGVVIDENGVFMGQATGDNGYILNFDCTNCAVVTDWRAAVSEGGGGGATTGSRAHPTTTESVEPPPEEAFPPATTVAPRAPSSEGTGNGSSGSSDTVSTTPTAVGNGNGESQPEVAPVGALPIEQLRTTTPTSAYPYGAAAITWFWVVLAILAGLGVIKWFLGRGS